MRNLSKTRKALAFAAVSATVLVGVGGIALATDRFSDVSNTNPFHDDINSIADAGITTGTGDGSTFDPQGLVKRQAMAAFMERGFGRVGVGTGDESTPATATIEAGAQGEGTQGFVLVTATWTAVNADTTAGNVSVTLTDGDTVPNVLGSSVETLGTSGSAASGSVSAVDTLTDGEIQSYSATYDAGSTTSTADITITAVYVPFDGDADKDPVV